MEEFKTPLNQSSNRKFEFNTGPNQIMEFIFI